LTPDRINEPVGASSFVDSVLIKKSGFRVPHEYLAEEKKRVETVTGSLLIRKPKARREINHVKQPNAVVPNLIHSLDAAQQRGVGRIGKGGPTGIGAGAGPLEKSSDGRRLVENAAADEGGVAVDPRAHRQDLGPGSLG
jgi:hypothetical protein